MIREIGGQISFSAVIVSSNNMNKEFRHFPVLATETGFQVEGYEKSFCDLKEICNFINQILEVESAKTKIETATFKFSLPKLLRIRSQSTLPPGTKKESEKTENDNTNWVMSTD